MDLNKYVRWHVDRMLKWSAGMKPGPLHVQFNPTDRCNIACRFCWQRDTHRLDYTNEITTERYVELIREAAELGVIRITVTGGGEPWMRPQTTMAIVEEVKQQGMYGFMITNGTLLNRERIERMVRAGWDEVTFSLDSPKEEHEDWLRDGKGSTKLTIANIRMLQEVKGELGATRPKVNIHAVLCNETYRELPALVELASALGVGNVFAEPFVVQAFDVQDGYLLRMSPEQAKEAPRYVARALELCNTHHIENNFESFLSSELIESVNRMDELIRIEGRTGQGGESAALVDAQREVLGVSPDSAENSAQSGRDGNGLQVAQEPLMPFFNQLCYEPWWNLIVRANGRVGPCCMFDYTAEYVHSRSLKDIWYGRYFGQLRGNIQQGKLLDFCARCNPSQVVDNRRIREEMRALAPFPKRIAAHAMAVVRR